MTGEELFNAIGKADDKFVKEIYGYLSSDILNKTADDSFDYSSSGERTIVMEVVKKRKNRIKIVAVILAAAVAAGAAAALFGTKKDKNEYKEKKIENYFREDGEIELPDKIMYVEEVYGGKGTIYLSAQMIGGGEEKAFAAVCRLKDGKYSEISLSDYGDYIGKVYTEEKYLYFEVMTGENQDGIYEEKCIVRADKDTGELKGCIRLAENEWTGEINEQPDGSTEMISYILTDGEISDCNRITYDKNLNEISRKDLEDKALLKSGQLFFGYLSDNEGNYYTLYRKDDDSVNMYKYTSAGDLLYSKENITEDMPGIPQTAFMSAENKPVVAVQENSAGKFIFHFDEFDPETFEVSGRYDCADIEAGYIMMADADGEEYEKYDFVFNQNGSIFGYEMKYDELTEICSKDDMLKYSDSETYINYAAISGNSVVFSGKTVTGDEDWGSKIIQLNSESQDFSYISVPDEYNIRSVSEGPDGMIYMLVSVWHPEDYSEDYSIIKADKTGEILSTVGLDYSESLYSESFIVSENGTALVNIDGGTAGFFDSSGKLLKEIAFDSYNLYYFRSGNDCYVCYSSIDGKTVICKIDFENNTVSETNRIDYGFLKVYDGFGEYDAVFTMQDGIYGYIVSSGEVREIINWVDSDIELSPYYNYICPFSNDLIMTCENIDDNGNRHTVLSKIKRVSDDVLEKIQQRKIINIAATEVNSQLREFVRKFNTENENARIHIEDYSKYACNGVSYMYGSNGASKLSEDIIKGKVPDMIIFGDVFDRERFSGAGVFEDLNEYFEKDSEVNRSDFFENIFDSYSSDGKQYSIPLYFTLNGLMGRQEIIGDSGAISYERLKEIADSTDLFAYTSYDTLKTFLIMTNTGDYIDYTSGTCSFDSQNFIDTINIIKKYGMSDNDYNDLFKNDSESVKMSRKLYDKLCAFDFAQLSGFDSYVYTIQVNALKDPVFIGFPDDTSSGFTAFSSYNAAIFKSSEHKDEVWNFIKLLLSEDSQKNAVMPDNMYMWLFPVRRSAFDISAENSIKSSRYSNSYTNDCTGKHVKVRSVTANDVQDVKDIIESVSKASSADSSVQKIIDEQLDLFIADAQSAEETAKNVQSKVSLYLKEIK